MFKAFEFSEHARLEFRAETFNTFNHTQSTNPSTSVTAGNFGQITGTNEQRTFQFGANLLF